MLTTMLTPDELRSVIRGRIRSLLHERGGEVRAVSGQDKLNATLGLSSLDLALLVADLEAELGVDPFAKLVSITTVRSVEDLERAYQSALFPQAHPLRQDNDLASAAARAETRLARRKRQ